MLPKDADFTIMDYKPLYEEECDLQRYAEENASKYGIRVLHLKKDKAGTGKTQDAGWSDCMCYTSCGRSFFMELKTKSKLSEVQKEFRRWALSMGHKYEVALTPLEVDAIYDKYKN